MAILSFGKKKKAKIENIPPAEEDVFPELKRIKDEIDRTLPQPNMQQEMSPTFGREFENVPLFQQYQQGTPTQAINQPFPALPLQPQQNTMTKATSPTKQVPLETIEKEERPELYVKIDDYKKVLELLDKLKLKVKELETILTQLREMKENEMEKVEELKQQLEDAKENVNNILGILRQA